MVTDDETNASRAAFSAHTLPVQSRSGPMLVGLELPHSLSCRLWSSKGAIVVIRYDPHSEVSNIGFRNQPEIPERRNKRHLGGDASDLWPNTRPPCRDGVFLITTKAEQFMSSCGGCSFVSQA